MQTEQQSHEKKGREQRFVETVLSRCAVDKGLAARLRRADNPATEYQSWELLGSFGVDLERENERLAFVTIAATIAKSKSDKNGSLSLGKAIFSCYDSDQTSPQAKARLRRLLACSDTSEACRMLRPVLTLISSRVNQPLDYVRLLKQLRYFGHRTKSQWAQEFYGQLTTFNDKEAKA